MTEERREYYRNRYFLKKKAIQEVQEKLINDGNEDLEIMAEILFGERDKKENE
ncbi:MAG: hypothetical protein WC917_04950 [Bacilli bacterium]|jgi:hypothetical protein